MPVEPQYFKFEQWVNESIDQQLSTATEAKLYWQQQMVEDATHFNQHLTKATYFQWLENLSFSNQLILILQHNLETWQKAVTITGSFNSQNPSLTYKINDQKVILQNLTNQLQQWYQTTRLKFNNQHFTFDKIFEDALKKTKAEFWYQIQAQVQPLQQIRQPKPYFKGTALDDETFSRFAVLLSIFQPTLHQTQSFFNTVWSGHLDEVLDDSQIDTTSAKQKLKTLPKWQITRLYGRNLIFISLCDNLKTLLQSVATVKYQTQINDNQSINQYLVMMQSLLDHQIVNFKTGMVAYNNINLNLQMPIPNQYHYVLFNGINNSTYEYGSMPLHISFYQHLHDHYQQLIDDWSL